MKDTCGHELPNLDVHIDGHPVMKRDLPATTPEATPFFAFYHPAMQETLLQAAQDAGADIRRGVRVNGIRTGEPPQVTFQGKDGPEASAFTLDPNF